MKIAVKFFGYTAELAGCREASIEVAQPTVAGLEVALRREFPALRPVLDGTVRFAVGTEYAEPGTAVKEGDEVSMIPPIGGG